MPPKFGGSLHRGRASIPATTAAPVSSTHHGRCEQKKAPGVPELLIQFPRLISHYRRTSSMRWPKVAARTCVGKMAWGRGDVSLDRYPGHQSRLDAPPLSTGAALDARPWAEVVRASRPISPPGRWKSRNLGGRPRIDAGVRALIRRMSIEFPKQIDS